jgi:acetylornithine/succinyldiaminopimelate/putrescine aminotransferase/acyl-coenzyme A synthetase/AMP-(fatty) acid ligase
MAITLTSTVGPDFFRNRAYTLRDIIFDPLPNREENAVVIVGHIEDRVIEISLPRLRMIVSQLVVSLRQRGINAGDTVLLASFYSSNELANALHFAACASMGVRVFIPIFPEAGEFEEWRRLTQFKAVIMPYEEILKQPGHEREKNAIRQFTRLCEKNQVPFWDAYSEFDILSLLQAHHLTAADITSVFSEELTPDREAVIFTTSGTSGKSKLVVYRQGAFSISCQSWQEAGLFEPDKCGNAGFTPLFTHTIGIRHFINALWTGQPVCIMVISWFLEKPEEARYLLLQMKPGHIVGGAAMFNTLLELFRQYPELKLEMRETLKTLISIGSPFNTQTAQQLKSASGINLFNAFGTTETQMVLLNEAEGNTAEEMSALGKPLPGVSIRLEQTEEPGIYDLQIHSPYQSSRVLGEETRGDYFSTGDLVRYDEKGALHFTNRKGTDFIKDEFGVKVPVQYLQQYYDWLYEISTHVEWLPLNNKPGLAVLLFLKPEASTVSPRQVLDWIKIRNEYLEETLQPFEFTHRHLERINVQRTDPPLTRKGTVSRKDILNTYAELINNLKNPYVEDKEIERLEAEEHSLLYKFSNPRLDTLLETLKMNVQFEEAEKDWLFYTKDGTRTAVLDMVGGFGAGLTGHNHPGVKEAILNFLNTSRPALNTQGSLYHYPSLLAAALNKIFAAPTGKNFKVLLANTGAEAMEMALHHAYYEWLLQLEKRRDEQLQLYGSESELNAAAIWENNLKRASEAAIALLVINNCFHGYSSGARSLLNNKKQRTLFSGLLKPLPLHVNDRQSNWQEQIETHLNRNKFPIEVLVKEKDRLIVKQEQYSTIIASVVEPVRGEGGIYETNEQVIDFLSHLPFPLVADEIQCGLGRTGSLPATNHASCYLIGKSLGGGFEKIAAVLIEDKRFKEAFPQYYASTFANGEMAACAALKTLEIIQEEKYAATAAEKGDLFLSKLRATARRFPDIIESVNGCGLMIGIHFNRKMGADSILLRVLFEHELSGYLLAAWLFHNKNIRVLPSLSKPEAIRLEPSVYITGTEMDLVCEALDELCRLCRNKNIYELLRFLMNDDPYLDKKEHKPEGVFPSALETPPPFATKVGFIGNFTTPIKELAFIEPDLQKASDTGLRILFRKLQVLLEGKPIRLFSSNLFGGRINFTFYILPFDTAHLEVVQRWGKKRFYISKIQEAANLLMNEGVSHISLGAHTSILSGNGLFLAEKPPTKILTGNTMTVASALYHTEKYLGQAVATIPELVIAVVGANGNIGSGLAACFTGESYRKHRILLIGNQEKKLNRMKQNLFGAGQPVTCSTDLFELKQADIIISCTNTNDPIIFPHHLSRDKKVFIIDIAVPGSVAGQVKQMENVMFCREASTMYLPDDPSFAISTHTPVGKVFCCAAEVILAALYDVDVPLKGHIHPAAIKEMMQLGVKENMFQKPVYEPLV